MQPDGWALCYFGVYMERVIDSSAVDPICARLAHDLDGTFAELMAAHQDLVFGVALRVLRDHARAQDVFQDSFVRAYRALRRYPPERIRVLRPRPWLARIALNAARNSLRQNRPATDITQIVEALAAADDGPSRVAERGDERRMWARLLAALPDRYRLPVALRHIDGLSYAELAETLGRPLGTVKSDVHRGTALLRAAYDAEQREIAHREAV